MRAHKTTEFFLRNTARLGMTTPPTQRRQHKAPGEGCSQLTGRLEAAAELPWVGPQTSLMRSYFGWASLGSGLCKALEPGEACCGLKAGERKGARKAGGAGDEQVGTAFIRPKKET
jgi:hypothetical protein